MNTLFQNGEIYQTPDAPKGMFDSLLTAIERINTVFIPILHEIGMDAYFKKGDKIYHFHQMKDWRKWSGTDARIFQEEGAGIQVIVTSKDKKIEKITQVFVRPTLHSIANVSRILREYPHWNLSKEQKLYPNENKIELVLQDLKKWGMHFCVIIPRPNSPSLIWWDKYANYSMDKWNLTWRNNPKNLNRIKIKPKYQNGNWVVTEQELKHKILTL